MLMEFLMPADFIVDVPLRTVFSSASGVVFAADIQSHMDRLSRHPDFHPEFNQILDMRRVTEFKLSSEELRDFAQRSIFSSTSKRSFLVATELHFGLARMFEAYRQVAGEKGIKVVSDLNEARLWVGLPPEGP